jgi:hypothetical protein
MKNIIYDIYSFWWNGRTKTFVGEEPMLYPVNDVGYYKIPFPNQRKQFFIKNPKTSGFRRFRFKTETETSWIFESEDGIYCKIIKEHARHNIST